MSDSFLTSEEYADRAHRLYNEGQYDEAVALLSEALSLYPYAAELHVGMGYARLAREEFAWCRHAFQRAVALDPNNEEALAGLGEVLLKLGERTGALECFDGVLELGFREDHDLMLQVGRALFREGMLRHAHGFFELAVEHHEQSSEAAACVGYSAHRLGEEDAALYWLRRALDLDQGHAEARIYLGNLLYDRGEYDAALFHFEQSEPGDHVDELAVWRTIELKKSIYRLPGQDPELASWHERLAVLATEQDPLDKLLSEVEGTQPDGTVRDPNQLELFGTLLVELEGMHRRTPSDSHRVRTSTGVTYSGTWDEIVLQMKTDDRAGAGTSVAQYMEHVAQRNRRKSGLIIPVTDAEAFVRGVAAAGLLNIIS